MEQETGIPPMYRIPLDVILAILLVLPSAILNIIATPSTPYQRGFYCDDHSVRYPYKSDTVSTSVLVAVCGLVPLITIIICESVLYTKHKNTPETGVLTKHQYSRTRLGSARHANGFSIALYKYIGGFIIGVFINLTLTDCSKFLIGRLRPHFLSVCAINYDEYCPQGLETYMYIENATCGGDGNHEERDLIDARLSFPSGHASTAFYASVFLIVYLHLKMDWYNLLRTSLQVCCFAFALLTALSRVSDYKHHPADVLFGGLLGTAVALYTVTYICDLHDMYQRACMINNHLDMQKLSITDSTKYGSVSVRQQDRALSESTAVQIET